MELFLISFILTIQQVFKDSNLATLFISISGLLLIVILIKNIIRNPDYIGKFSFIHIYIIFIVLIAIALPVPSQIPNYAYNPDIGQASYPNRKGSIIFIDETHLNLHTLKNRWYMTGKLLEKDGYRVYPFDNELTHESISECDIFIVVNATHEKNRARRSPTYPAFTQNEISVIKNWVKNGGSLLLIADHMPFAGAINNLAMAFGFSFENGHAINQKGKPDVFTRTTNSLTENIITNNDRFGRLDSILTLSGSAFKAPNNATTILKLDTNWVSYNVSKAWDFEKVQPIHVNGYSQGAFVEFGNGKIAVFGESAMFSATLGGGLSWKKLGMSSYHGRNNYKLLLNTVSWLDNKLE